MSTASVTIPEFFKATPIEWGAGDLFLFEGEDSLELLAEVCVLLGCSKELGAPQASAFVLIDSWIASSGDGHKRLSDCVRELCVARCSTDEDSSDLLSRITLRVVEPAISSVIEAAERLPRRTILLIANIGSFSDRESSAENSQGDAPDDWVESSARLLTSLRAVAERLELYIVAHEPKSAPPNSDHSSPLFKINGIGVWSGSSTPSIQSIVTRLPRWLALVREGALADALRELEILASTLPREQALIRSKLLLTAGLIEPARIEFNDFLSVESQVSVPMSLLAASIAIDLEDGNLAAEFARPLLVEPLHEIQAEFVLKLAQRSGDADFESDAFQSLSRSHPQSELLRETELNKCIDELRFMDASDLLARSTEQHDLQLSVLLKGVASLPSGLTGEEILSQLQAVAQSHPHQADQIRQIASRILSSRGFLQEAILVLVLDDFSSEAPSPSLATSALRQARQANLTTATAMSSSELGRLLTPCVRVAATHPSDLDLRLSLLRIFEPELLGNQVPVIAATLLLVFANQMSEARRTRERKVAACDHLLLTEFMSRGIEWMAFRGRNTVGGQRVPRELLTAPADELISGIDNLLIHAATHARDESHIAALMTMLGLAAGISHLGSSVTSDLTSVRIAAVSLIEAGFRQTTRDLAEQVMAMAGSDPYRTRKAWYAYADIYARLGSLSEAAVALACAFASSASPTWEDVWQESSLAARILRDLGVTEAIGRFLATQRQAVLELDLPPRYSRQITTFELQIRRIESERHLVVDRKRRLELLTEVSRHVEEVLSSDSELAPSTILLASTIRLNLDCGNEPPKVASKLLQTLAAKLPVPIAVLAEVEATQYPSLSQLVELARREQQIRFGVDSAYDSNRLQMFARRALSNPTSLHSEAAAYAIEASADRLVRDEKGAAIPDVDLLTDASAPLNFAERTASSGLSLALLAEGSNGLVRMIVANGIADAPVTEPVEVFSLERLRTWRAKYPYMYAFSNEPNEFYVSTQGIGLSTLPDRCLIVSSTRMQLIPPQLLNVDGDLVGTQKRVASCPSLTWLNWSRGRGGACSTRRIAWIPSPTEGSTLATLDVLAERLAPSFVLHDIEMARGANPPGEMRAADLVIIVAHGSTVAENHYFRSVQDDEGNPTRVQSLSAAAHGSTVVILFVCSGGRQDRHPESNTILGLTRQLLDSGCCAVVASPWPLETRVPPTWLPAFLDSWKVGRPVIDACYDANRAVITHFGHDLKLALAMSVYGDPLATRGYRLDVGADTDDGGKRTPN